ncbi:hypothetical protein N7540_011253 [Penicillium herquei]|nr:hypothetical protein N7540_011253 [Penicillium herquei]
MKCPPSPHERTRFLSKIVGHGLLQAIVLGLFVLSIYSLVQCDTNISNMRILYVDYDQGVVGTSIRNAYIRLQGKSFPNIVERPKSEFLHTAALESAVCQRIYHAALFTSRGASERLTSELVARSDLTIFNRSDTLMYVWNKHQYPRVMDSIILNSIETLSTKARAAFTRDLEPEIWSTISQDPTSLPILRNPWLLTAISGEQELQYSFPIAALFLVFVTLVQAPIILEAVDTLCMRLKLHGSTTSLGMAGLTILISAAWTLLSSLFTILVFRAFCPNWPIGGYQFLQFWVVLWILSHVNFLVCDTLPFVFPNSGKSRILVGWILLNITSASLLLDFPGLTSNWGMAVPAYLTCEILIDIWAPGCDFRNFVAIFTLASLEVLCLMLRASVFLGAKGWKSKL